VTTAWSQPVAASLAAEVERLRAAGLSFRNDIVSGPGGRELLLDDPAGNPIEHFPARRRMAVSGAAIAAGPQRGKETDHGVCTGPAHQRPSAQRAVRGARRRRFAGRRTAGLGAAGHRALSPTARGYGFRVRHPALGTFVFFVAAPGTTAGLVPWLVTGWASPPGWDAVDLLGVLVGLVGLAMVVACFVRFVREGRGTPAPTAPTEELVVGGLYRYLRNPMYVGVGLVIAGQCLAFRSLSLVVWLALFTVAVTVFVVVYEQPTLRARYGASYDAYCGSVPAMVPRLRQRTRSTRPPAESV
jgi:protein-S-isoprenylcysteine O-methyltransferase Ste14